MQKHWQRWNSAVRRLCSAEMDSRVVLAFILISSLGFSGAFWLGASSNDGTVRFHKGSQFGFEKNPQIYSHLVIPPWNRPFKPGYCASWEWHTDKKYRDKRVAICKQYTEGKYSPQFWFFFFFMFDLDFILQSLVTVIALTCKWTLYWSSQKRKKIFICNV